MRTAILAALVAMTLTACGGGDADSDARRANPAVASPDPGADLWAEQAYAQFGESAVYRCLAGFHAKYIGAAGNAGDYRTELAQYMCACARGPSQQECPQP
jgi:hypothetical protein